MADTDGLKEAKNFHEDVPMRTPGFFLRGAGSLDWGMKNRLARIFNPETARTVMLAIDHGYFQGPTTGLERVDLNIVPLMPMADALMLTRGILRTTVPPAINKPIVMRCSGGPSILKELSDEVLAVDIEDAIRMNVSALTPPVIGPSSTITARPVLRTDAPIVSQSMGDRLRTSMTSASSSSAACIA
jgi:putative autoinducer-2 (AI-2) aldolase